MERSFKWILLVSLLVNAGLVGFVSAHLMREYRHPMAAMRIAARERHEVSDKTRAALDAAFATERPAMEEAVRAMLDARRKSVALIRAEPLDAAALDVELAQMRMSNMQAQEVFHRVVRTAAQQLNAEQRVSLSRMLEGVPPGRFGNMGALGPPGGTPWRREGQRDELRSPPAPEAQPSHP